MKKIIAIISSIVVGLILLITLTGCDYEAPAVEQSSYEQSIKANEESAKAIISSDTLPKLTRSLERENIKRRLEFINQPDNVGYLYLISANGQLIREIQVLGKVSSLNSYLTPMEQIEWFNKDLGEYWGDVPIVTSAPDLDGTYGENDNGIFWFDMNGIYGEWNGLYQYSSQRMTFTTQPLLIENIEEDK